MATVDLEKKQKTKSTPKKNKVIGKMVQGEGHRSLGSRSRYDPADCHRERRTWSFGLTRSLQTLASDCFVVPPNGNRENVGKLCLTMFNQLIEGYPHFQT